MNTPYDKYYQAENLFGEPYPELLEFYSKIQQKGKLLDLGCGQGRDAIALAKIGFEVTGLDNSEVGIEQLNSIAQKEKLPLVGIVTDIYKYSKFDEFDFILLDSMFHFGKKERAKEVEFLKRIFEKSKPNTLITICIQHSKKKLEILNSILSESDNIEVEVQIPMLYKFEDKESGHSSETKYELISLRKF